MCPTLMIVRTMIQLTEFETERLCLRQWRPQDREPFAELNADPKVMEYLPALLDREASDAMADRYQSLIAERGWGFWAVEKRDTKQFIGFVGLHIPVAELPFSPCVEIGWRLAFQYWGKGFATEAAKTCLRVGFGLLGLSEIVSFTTVRNFNSRAVMARLGMRECAETFEHPHVPPGSALREHCLYRLSREQWCDVPAARYL
jgi:RimJ/RimL family protein N-acetyltransferase